MTHDPVCEPDERHPCSIHGGLWTKGWATLRESLIASDTLVPVEGGASLRLTTDQVFKSPSAAAAILLGRTANGLIEWKDSSGSTLKQLREQTVAATPDAAAPGQ